MKDFVVSNGVDCWLVQAFNSEDAMFNARAAGKRGLLTAKQARHYTPAELAKMETIPT